MFFTKCMLQSDCSSNSNPIAHIKAKNHLSFGNSHCNRVKHYIPTYLTMVILEIKIFVHQWGKWLLKKTIIMQLLYLNLICLFYIKYDGIIWVALRKNVLYIFANSLDFNNIYCYYIVTIPFWQNLLCIMVIYIHIFI